MVCDTSDQAIDVCVNWPTMNTTMPMMTIDDDDDDDDDDDR